MIMNKKQRFPAMFVHLCIHGYAISQVEVALYFMVKIIMHDQALKTKMQTQEEKEQTEEGEHQLKKFYFERTVTDLLGVTTWHLLVSRLLPEFVMIELALEPWCFLPALWMFPSERRVLTTLHFL
jgi:hypothetical protein